MHVRLSYAKLRDHRQLVGRTFGEGFHREVVVCCTHSNRACPPSCGSITSCWRLSPSCTMFFSRHQARRLSPTHRHRTASASLTRVSAGRPSTHQGHTVSAAASLPVVTPDTELSMTSSSAPWRQPTY